MLMCVCARVCFSPVERSQSEHQLILSALKLFPVLIDQIDPPELYYISRIVMIETLDRGHISETHMHIHTHTHTDSVLVPILNV